MSGLRTLSETGFDTFLQSSEFVLVDFFATWCPPCRALLPILDAAHPEFAGRIEMGKLNIDEAGKLAAQFAIRSVPTMILFRHGQQFLRHTGLLQAAQLRTWLRWVHRLLDHNNLFAILANFQPRFPERSKHRARRLVALSFVSL